MSFCTRVKTSFLRPSRQCWREGEQWGAQPEPLSFACSRFHGLRRWFAFLGQQPAIGKQETSRQASLLHTKWHERDCDHNCAYGMLRRRHCLSLQIPPPFSSLLTHNCPKPELYAYGALPGDTSLPLESRLYHLAFCLVYKISARLREELYLPTELGSSELPLLFLPLWYASWG